MVTWPHVLGQSIMVAGVCRGRASSLHGAQKAENKRGPGAKHNLQRHTPSDLLPPARPHILRFPQPPAGDHMFHS
jgi:hypothetical protein